MPRRKQPAAVSITETAQRIHWWVYVVFGGIAGVAIVVWGAAQYLGQFAMASAVTEHEKQLIILKTQREDDSKRIDWLVETVGQLSARQGIATPPVSPRHKVEDGK